MSSAKKLFAPLLALGGTGVWMFTNSGNRETRRGGNFSLNLGVFMNPQEAGTKKKNIQKAKVEEPPRQPVEPKGDNDTLQSEDPGKEPEVPKDIQGPEGSLKEPEEAPELGKNLEETEDRAGSQQNLKVQEEAQNPKNLGRSDDGEELPDLLPEEKDETPDPKEEISGAGLDCGKAEGETICTILEGGINVDRGDGKKEGYVLKSGADNGKIKFRISEETDTYSNGFRFTIFEKPITLKNKNNPSDTITLEKYESYGLVKEGDKVYLTRKLTANEGIIKSLGLPDKCVLPTAVSTDVFNYLSPKWTCQIQKNQIQSINFDGKGEGQTASGGSAQLYLYIQKVGDETTYKGGYKFFLHSDEDLNLPDGVKLAKKVWWDFRLKDPDADDLVLEKVWKNEDELLNKIGLSCKEDGTCSIKDNSLKIKIDGKVIENGKKKSGEGILYLEKNQSRYYEGLKFSVWGGEIKIEDSNRSTLEMKETEEYHVTKKDSNTPIFYLTRKQGAEGAITNFLGMSNCTPNPTKGSAPRGCTAAHPSLWRQFKFHDGEKEQTIKSNNSKLSVVITISQDSKLPFGYRYNLKPSEDLQIGKISLPKTGADFKIKRDVKNKKLYLEKA